MAAFRLTKPTTAHAGTVHVIGGGAVGTILAAYFSAARRKTHLVVRDKDLEKMSLVDAMCIDRVTSQGCWSVPKPSITTSYDFVPGDMVIIAVKHRDLGEVLEKLHQCDAIDSLTLLPCLNGIGTAACLRRHFPRTEVAQLTIHFNAQLLEPLHARLTTHPEVLINSRNRQLLRLFKSTKLDVHQAHDESFAWGKLLINLANALCALTHTTFKDLLTNPDLRWCYVRVMDEAVCVLNGAGVRYKLPLPLPYAAYRKLILHGGPLPWWFARMKNGLTESAYPSMVADLETGKTTEVAQLNGQIVDLASEHQLQSPINHALVDWVSALHNQSVTQFMSPAALRKKLAAI